MGRKSIVSKWKRRAWVGESGRGGGWGAHRVSSGRDIFAANLKTGGIRVQ